jgi:hypothetical protein
MATLYLLKTRAAKTYSCAACAATILRGEQHYRHDPHPMARRHRGETYSHWCENCILSANPGPPELVTKRIFLPRPLGEKSLKQNKHPNQLELFEPLKIEIVAIGAQVANQILKDSSFIYALSPEQFEDFICDRLFSMGLEPKKVGRTNAKDGGIDIVFWPRLSTSFPFLGAAQVKHHQRPDRKVSSTVVRDFAGSMSGQPFAAGILVTNTSFSPDAKWFADKRHGLVRLRDFADIRRWLLNDFSSEEEWREMPKSIELAPGVVIDLRAK